MVTVLSGKAVRRCGDVEVRKKSMHMGTDTINSHLTPTSSESDLNRPGPQEYVTEFNAPSATHALLVCDLHSYIVALKSRPVIILPEQF